MRVSTLAIGGLALLAVALMGCSLVPVIPAARIETSELLNTTYWGPPSNGLSAGIAIKGPCVDDKKTGDPPYLPCVEMLYKLRNVGERPIRLLSPAEEGSAAGLLTDPADPSGRLEIGWWGRDPSEVVLELAPGEEVFYESSYRIPTRPYQMAARFAYRNDAGETVVDRRGRASAHRDLWTGHVESEVLKAKIK